MLLLLLWTKLTKQAVNKHTKNYNNINLYHISLQYFPCNIEQKGCSSAEKKNIILNQDYQWN